MIKNIYILLAILLLEVNLTNGQSPMNLGIVCAEDTSEYGVSGFPLSEYIWAIEGGKIVNGNGTNNIEVIWGYKTGKYLLEVVEVTTGGCNGIPSVGNIEVQAPEVNLGFDYHEICENETYSFDATGKYVEPATFLWHDNSDGTGYIASQSEKIWVKVTDADGCVRYDSVEFTVNELPIIDLGKDTLLCDVQNPYEMEMYDNDGLNFANYEWFSSEQNALVSINPSYIAFPGRDTIILTVTDFKGCKGTDTISLFACNVEEMFKDMVNTFTPNADGQNDVWNITEFMHLFPEAVLEVFDRWGRLVYRTESVYTEPWDGKSNGKEMPMDSYFFVLELNYMNLEALSGTLNLIR